MTEHAAMLHLDAARARTWLLERAIPFWSVQGLDANGFAYEEARFDGRMRPTAYRRTMVQFRQVYVFANAALLGACSRNVALELFERTVSAAWHRDGGWIHKLDADGDVLDPTRDAYDHAFALLASAWIYRLERDPRYMELALRTLGFLDAQLSSPAGGYLESLPPRSPRRQNPHMHLYEALLAWYEFSGESAFLERLRPLRTLLESTFIDSSGALREYFGPSWQRLSDEAGDCVEPGHHFEWVWLLHRHAQLAETSLEAADVLYAFADRHGLRGGMPVEQLDARGGVTLRGVKLWALCEAIKASLIRRQYAASHVLIEALFARFLVAGEACGNPIWYEGILADDAPDTQRMPVSTLYHLSTAISELITTAGVTP